MPAPHTRFLLVAILFLSPLLRSPAEETRIANALRRSLRMGETEVVPRVSDLEALVSSTAGKVEIEASATFDGTTPKEITFSMSYERAALGGQFAGVAEISSGATQPGAAEITFDLTQPEMREAAALATAALKRGDVVGASQALSGVMDRAQIVVQQAVGSQSTVGFDAKVVSGELTTNASVTLSLIHISEPTRLLSISYAVFCLKKKKKYQLCTRPTFLLYSSSNAIH